jgi:cytoskeletal protein CcmA (bactofilin family)
MPFAAMISRLPSAIAEASSAVVEGEIFHRSLAIEENAWFAGVSRPEEASASGVTDQLVPTDGNRQINGSLENEVHADTTTVS